MSETNSRNNEPCNYYGLNVCDSKGDCDKEHFDCITNHPNGDYCTTGLCPGDDKKKDSYDHKNMTITITAITITTTNAYSLNVISQYLATQIKVKMINVNGLRVIIH